MVANEREKYVDPGIWTAEKKKLFESIFMILFNLENCEFFDLNLKG